MRALLAVMWPGLLASQCPQRASAEIALESQPLSSEVEHSTATAVTSGALDSEFSARSRGPKGPRHEYWLKLSVHADPMPVGVPVLKVHATR